MPATLQQIPGFPFDVHASRGAEAHAREIAAMVQDARGWFAKTLGVDEAATSVLVLSEQDWSRHCPIPVFGVPYEDNGRGVIVGHGRAQFMTDFVDRALPHVSAQAKADLKATFGHPADATPYLDLVAVHELAHGVQIQQGGPLPTFWLYELWPQLAMTAYVASRHPGKRAVLDLLHDASGDMPKSALPASGLGDMETSFQHGAWLYAWYEFRLGALSKIMWDTSGTRALEGLFHNFRSEDMSDDEILDGFAKIDPRLAEILTTWPTLR